MADDRPSVGKKKTGQFMKQGHTAGIYGNDPNVESKAGKDARELNA